MLTDPRLAALRRALSQHHSCRIPAASGWQRAAVALVVRPAPEDLELLLIRRATYPGDPWSGHMAFPGGRSEPDDPNARSTAIRETSEEVGIDLIAAGAPLGALDEVRPAGPGVPPIVVSPHVFAAAAHVHAEPNLEVEAAVWIPLQVLALPSARAEFLYQMSDGMTVHFPALAYREHTIWGLTYRILTQFLHLAGAAGRREP